MEKLKENKCAVVLVCREEKKDCVYFKPTKEHRHCKYYDWESCNSDCKSAVAQVNAMVLALQDMGFDVTLKGGDMIATKQGVKATIRRKK